MSLHWIKSKFPNHCAVCLAQIKIHDHVLYSTEARAVACQECGECAQDDEDLFTPTRGIFLSHVQFDTRTGTAIDLPFKRAPLKRHNRPVGPASTAMDLQPDHHEHYRGPTRPPLSWTGREPR